MYKPFQKKNSSWTPPTGQSQSKSASKLGHFSIQPQPHEKSSPSPEIAEYSRKSADGLADNVIRGLPAKELNPTEPPTVQHQSESAGTSGFNVTTPITQTPTPEPGTAFPWIPEPPIQRQSADGTQPKQEQLDTNNPNQIWQRAQSITPVVQRGINEYLQMGEMVQRAFQIEGNQASGDLESQTLPEKASVKITSSLASPNIQLDYLSRDPIHQGMIDDYRRWRGLPANGIDEWGHQVGATDAQIKYRPRTEPPLTQPEIEQRLEGEVIRLANGADSLLQRDYVQTALAGRAQNSELQRAFNEAIQQVGQDIFDIQMGRIERAASSIIHLLETQFINDPNTSSLDLLPPNQRQRYRNFAWSKQDYPGGEVGPNEGRANQMAANLSNLRPERRANLGTTAVVTRSEFNARMQQYVQSELRTIPNFSTPGQQGQSTPQQPAGQRLNQQALEAFLRMRDAALQDGVVLIVRDSYRTPAAAASNAASSGNPTAVASFSSHSLGLAIDLNMSFTSQTGTGVTQQHQFIETTTTPMQNVVDMRQSPTHKWLFLRGAMYGWYPYQHEPWHWEYNPPGFREQFREGLQQSGRSTSSQATVPTATGGAVQPKLTVGQPGDKYEQEADHVAAQVMGMANLPDETTHSPIQSDPITARDVQRQSLANSITPFVQREITENTGADLTASNTLERRLTNSKGGGNPLSNEAQSFMEPRFGVDFSQVRVHTGADAVQMNQELNAKAFTQGHDIYFGQGNYHPTSNEGKELLAHELTHVVQQTGANTLMRQSQFPPTIQRQTPSEKKAEEVTPEEVKKWPELLPTASRGAGQAIKVVLASTKGAPTLKNADLTLGLTLTDKQKAIVKKIIENRHTIDTSMLKLQNYETTIGTKKINQYGYMYGGKTPNDPTAIQQMGANPTDRKSQVKKIVWDELKHEGGTSSINAYDKMMVTWGRGFGANGGQLPEVLKELFKDQAIVDGFLPYGITYQGGFKVVNTINGAIETGVNALSIIQAEPKLLGVFIRIAEDSQLSQKVTDAQWNAMDKKAGNVPQYAYQWDNRLIALVAHITHWWPATGWNGVSYDNKNTIADILMTWGAKAAGSPEASGALIVSNADTINNFKHWGSGVAWNAIQTVCSMPLPYKKHEIQDDKKKELSGKLFILAPGSLGYYVFPQMPTPTVNGIIPANVSKENYYHHYIFNMLEMGDMLKRIHAYDQKTVNQLLDNYDPFIPDFGLRNKVALQAVAIKKKGAKASAAEKTALLTDPGFLQLYEDQQKIIKNFIGTLPKLQKKALTGELSQSSDRDEQEAERVAAQVMEMGHSRRSRTPQTPEITQLTIQRTPAPPTGLTRNPAKLKIVSGLTSLNYFDVIHNNETRTIGYTSDTWNFSSTWSLFDPKDTVVNTNSEVGGGHYALTAEILKNHVDKTGITAFGTWTLRYQKGEFFDDLLFDVTQSGRPGSTLTDAVTTSSLFNIRELPGSKGKVLGQLSGTATSVTVSDKAKIEGRIWYKITLKAAIGTLKTGTEGWVIDDGVVATVPWDVFLSQLRKFETANSGLSLDQRITKLRQMCHKKDLPFDSIIGTSSGSEYLDTRNFTRSEWQILEGSLQVVQVPDGSKVDMYHLMVGLDVLPRRVEKQTYYNFNVGQNYSASTWSGDIGAGAADAFLGQDKDWEKANTIPSPDDPNRTSKLTDLQNRYYTTRAPESDLLGDIDAWGVDDLRSDKSLDTIEKLLVAYYGGTVAAGSGTLTTKRKSAIERFLKHYGFKTASPLVSQSSRATIVEQILLFAKMWIRNRASTITIATYSESDLSKWYVEPMSDRFLNWLEGLAKANGASV